MRRSPEQVSLGKLELPKSQLPDEQNADLRTCEAHILTGCEAAKLIVSVSKLLLAVTSRSGFFILQISDDLIQAS